VLQALLRDRADVNARDKDGMTAVFLASLAGHVEVLRLLHDQRADINTRDTIFRKTVYSHPFDRLGINWQAATPVFHAASAGHLEALRWLHNNGANLDSVTLNRAPLLGIAAEGGNADVLRYLLDQRADVNQTDVFGRTAACYAASMGHTSALRLLHAAHADLNAGFMGVSPSMIAAAYRHSDAVRLLHEARADLSVPPLLRALDPHCAEIELLDSIASPEQGRSSSSSQLVAEGSGAHGSAPN